MNHHVFTFPFLRLRHLSFVLCGAFSVMFPTTYRLPLLVSSEKEAQMGSFVSRLFVPSFSEIFFWSIGFHVFSWPFCYSFPYVITFSFSLRIKLNEHSQCVDIIWSTLFLAGCSIRLWRVRPKKAMQRRLEGPNWTLCMKLTCSDDYRGARVLTGQMYVACLVRYRELRTECL